MSPLHHESRFEDAIEDALLASGWRQGSPANYRRDLALDTGELFAFIGATQARTWDRLRDFFADADEAQRRFTQRVAAEIDARGALDVLRHGITDRGVKFHLAYFRPEHTLANDALVEYEQNRLTVTRQLHYSEKTPDHSLDLTLFVNGIPVATAELKNQLTGQNVEQAKEQYRTHRDPTEPIFARRALVHFAVDTELVFVTTKLAGRDTRFLPFNTGSAGPGVSGGAGNPPAVDTGYRTDYLWNQIWAPDTWLDLLRRFVHVEDDGAAVKGKKKPQVRRTIFPRFHQWHAVTRLVDHAATHGPGHNYLVMHSAGSGKSNTIAWLAHRLSSLHTPEDPAQLAPEAQVQPNQKVFDKVIVITDRSVLDRQLQQTIYQFEHATGVVRRISDREPGSKSQQVADALGDATSKIIIVTVQTFPYVLDLTSQLRGSRFAIIIDEAHSSQSGDAATALKKVLLKLGSDDIDADADPLTASALARGHHANLSYFAFTATPKPKTLQLFGTPDAIGNPHPFHVYSMRQAIEEGFILDVLRNYVTYATYWRLANKNPRDPEVDEKKAGRELARFVSLHETNLSQRAEIVAEHFRTHTRDRLGGRAKAMVVTRSREHAVRFHRALRDYVSMRGYDVGVLVAFSGEVDLGGDDKVTEPSINGISVRELPSAFGYTKADDPHAAATGKPEYRILVVAEKYQTGFDQPLLTTMYVDKKLGGVAAVQTLSRLNRIHPRKSQDDIFVLDFANAAADIQAEFRPFFESATTMPSDPNLLYTAQREVMEFTLLAESEMDAFVHAYLDAQRTSRTDAAWQQAHASLYRFTEPAVDRFTHLLEEDADTAEAFRSTLRDYVRKYAFLAQIVPYQDASLERLYLYGKHLLNRLPRRGDAGVDIGAVDLTHLRITRTGEQDVSLSAEGEQMLPGFADGGAGAGVEPEAVPLSVLIQQFNERFGTDLGEDDIIAPRDAAAEVPKIKAAAFANDLSGFGEVFDDVFEDKVYDRIEQNTTFLKRFADDGDFRSELTTLARRQAYEMIRRGAA